jgi:hypothetical protein
MAKGAFIVHENENGIVIANAGGDGPVPDDQRELVLAVCDFETTLKLLFSNKPDKYRPYFDRLLSTAQSGLVGDNPITATARASIEQMKMELSNREGRGIKTRYLVEMGWMCLASAVLTMLLFLTADNWRILVTEIAALKHYFAVWAGAMVGLWVSYAVRRSEVSYEELATMDRRTTEAGIRVIFVGLVASTFALFLSTSLIDLSIGGLDLNDFRSSAEIALLIGIIAGFSEQTLPTRLLDVSKSKIDKLA